MKWEIRVDGRRYRLRNRGLFSFGMTVVALLAAGLVFIVVGIICSNPGQAEAPAAEPGNPAPDPAAAGASAVSGEDTAPPGAPSGDWRLVLVNETHPLPEGFTVEIRELPNGLGFDARAYDDLMRMLEDSRTQGLSLVVCSAYRSNEKQKELYDSKVARIQQEEGKTYEQAYEEARNTVALPGTSEHNLGLAADIVARSYQQLDEGYLHTPECKWLAENAYRYGFIMRYPEGKSDITKIIFEPWHYRYVGKDAAKEIQERGICLEEYLGELD